MIRTPPRRLAALLAGSAGEPAPAGEGGAAVVRLTLADGRRAFLKHGVGSTAADIADEADRLRWLQGRMPCAAVLHHASEGGGAWLLTEALPGRTGDEILAAEPHRWPAVIAAFASFVRRLHALPVAECPFEAGVSVRLAAARRNIDAGLVDETDFDDARAGWSAERVWRRLQELVPASTERVVTHGDLSLGNLVLDDACDVSGVIDVGRLGLAERYQDIAILWSNLAEFGAAAQSRWLAAAVAEPVDRRRLEFHCCLDELF